MVDGGIELVEAGGTRTASGEGGRGNLSEYGHHPGLIQNFGQGPTDLSGARVPPGPGRR